jgi:hypothetical protein
MESRQIIITLAPAVAVLGTAGAYPGNVVVIGMASTFLGGLMMYIQTPKG